MYRALSQFDRGEIVPHFINVQVYLLLVTKQTACIWNSQSNFRMKYTTCVQGSQSYGIECIRSYLEPFHFAED